MATGSSGAVFFLGTRAHYQVLNQPESKKSYDVQNGNVSTETVYQNPSTVQELWPKEQINIQKNEIDNNTKWEQNNWNYCEQSNNGTGAEDKEKTEPSAVVKRRSKRTPSETALCERDGDMKPAQLNNVGDGDAKAKPSRRRTLLTYLTSLASRKRRIEKEQIQYMKHLDALEALTTCTYRESCRCFECQSRYFECDESDEHSSSDEYGYGSYYNNYDYEYVTVAPAAISNGHCADNYDNDEDDDDDDEVFVDTVPGDNTSTDLLIEEKDMSIASDDVLEEEKPEDNLELEVAAGTPVILNYLLTHPITCTIQ